MNREQISKLLDEAYDTRINDLKTSVELAGQALTLSQGAGDAQLIGRSLSLLSLFQMIKGEAEESKRLAEEAIRYFKEVDDDRGIADAKYNIAGLYYKTDNFHLGLIYLIDCLKTYRKYDDYHNQSRVLKSMGAIYEFFGDTKKAIEAYEEAIECGVKSGGLNLQSNAYNPLSGIYLNQGDIPKALEMIERSIRMKKESRDIRGLAFALYGRGKVFTKMGMLLEAEDDFNEALIIHNEMGERLGKGMCFLKLGALYIDMNKIGQAKEMLRKSLDFSETHRIIYIVFKSNLLLYELYKKEGDQAAALQYLERYLHQKESVINTQTSKVIESYEAITRMESMEKETRLQREKAEIIEKKNLELDAFFYRVSHDLKGPITSLLGLDEVARQVLNGKEATTFLDKYKTQVMRINGILDSLIKITRLSHDSSTRQEIDFEKLIGDCINSYQYLPNFDQVHFEVEIQQNVHLVAEWALVNTIIQNLIENSIKYSRIDQEKPFTKIRVTEADSLVKIEVEDNGRGMDEDTRENLFEMFYRGDTRLQGSGLGLFILHKSVEKLNGKTDIQTTLDQGSTFTISIPVSQD